MATVRNPPRNVLGGSEVWGGLMPGVGIFNFALLWFSVPAEVFLRRDFGERHFTRNNFIAGLLILFLIRAIAALTSLIPFVSSNDPEYESWMGTVTKFYIYFSIGHFLRGWWNELMGNSIHSYSSGLPWLLPVGKAVMFILNRFARTVIRIISKFLPSSPKEKLLKIRAVLHNPYAFTEKFIEPLVLLILAIICLKAGQTSTYYWLLFSILALNFTTGMRQQAQRGAILDIRDQFIEARFWQEALRGEDSPGAANARTTIRKTASEIEKTPEMMSVIEVQHPTLADAIAAMNPKLKQDPQQTSPPMENSSNTPVNGSAA